MNNELFLLVTILALRLADGITSYLPAQGFIEGLTEANPIASAMIEKWGFLWGFVAMLVISMAFVIAFLVATYLEEVRKAHKGDLRSVRRIRSVRFAGLTILAVLSSLPVLNNLILALHL